MAKYAPVLTSGIEEWVRLPASRAELLKMLGEGARLSDRDREVLRLLRREYQKDAEMEDSPRYSLMLDVLYRELDENDVFEAVITPGARIDSGAGYPLTAQEVAELCRTLGQHVEYKTVERLAKDGFISPPVLIGDSELPRAGYFARHVVEVLFRNLLGISPSRMGAQLEVFRADIPREVLLYYRDLPGVDHDLVDAFVDRQDETVRPEHVPGRPRRL